MDTDSLEAGKLLGRFAARRDPRDFEAIVSQFAGMVIGVAQRRTGDRGLAEEVAQNVFTLLARKAAEIDVDNLAGWLHRTALLDASNASRKETRRKRKHKRFSEDMKSHPSTYDRDQDDWREALPELDAAIDELPEGERKVVMLRFFENRSFREIGAEIGRGEDAGRKRLSSALEKLSRVLKSRGVVLPAAALGACLTENASSAVPTVLVKSLSQTAVAGAATSSTLSGTVLGIMATTKLTAAALLAAGIAIPLSIQYASGTNAAKPDRAKAAPIASLIHTSGENTGSTGAEPARQLIGIDLKALAAEISRLPLEKGMREKELELQLLMFDLSDDQLMPMLEILKSAKDPTAMYKIGQALFSRWAESDPRGALEIGLQSNDRNLLNAARDGALGTWAIADPDEAIAFVEDGHTDLAYLAFSTIAEHDPADALKRSLSVKDKEVREKVTKFSVESWARSDPAAAFEWATSRKDEATRRRRVEHVLSGLAGSYPDLSLELALTVDHPPLREGAARWALMQWGPMDPDAAAAAYLNLPDEVRTENLSSNVSGFLSAGDPERALMIADQLPEGSSHRHEFVVQAIDELVNSDPQLAAEHTETLPKGRRRDRYLERVAKAWLKQDHNAAMEWIGKTGALPEHKVPETSKK